jgi:hypothetical protein
VYDFLLFVHVLFAFGLVAALTLFWALILTTRPGRESAPPDLAMWLGRLGAILVGVSMMGALVFGVWLAIYVDGYKLWDGWILGSLLLWAIAGAAGQRSGVHYQRAADEGADAVALRRSGLQFQVASTGAVALLLVLMIFKPGA